MDLRSSGSRVSDPLCRPVAACRNGLDPPIYYDLRSWRPGSGGLVPGCLDAEGLEWIGGGDGGDGILGRGDWKKFPHARASGARRMLPPNLGSANSGCIWYRLG